MLKLGVNIDHIATIRQARKTNEPDPINAATIAERAGADGITAHLREDRRHIQDRDIKLLRQVIATRLNLEMGISDEIIAIALAIKPEQVTLVPERREEITTEGGLDVSKEFARLEKAIKKFRVKKIMVSLFIEPNERAIVTAKKLGADFIELHTGAFANTYPDEAKMSAELARLRDAAGLAEQCGLRVNAGHGLTYHNVLSVAAIPQIEELNIGHGIISRAVFTGLTEAVAEMKRLLLMARTCR